MGLEPAAAGLGNGAASMQTRSPGRGAVGCPPLSPGSCTPDLGFLIWLQHTTIRPATTLHRLAPIAPSHPSPYTGWPAPRRPTLDPNQSEDSSAPRRQLDGGIPPAADCRGGGQARP